MNVEILPWDSLTDLKSLMDAAGQTDAEILYLAPSGRQKDIPPAKRAEATEQFGDPNVVLVVVGEGPPLLIRRSFLLSASVSLNPRTDIADVGQDLLDHAGRSGYAARWLR